MRVAQSAVAQLAAQSRPEQSATKPAKKPQPVEKSQTRQAGASGAKKASGASEVVRLTSQKGGVVERQNPPKPDIRQTLSRGGQDLGAKQIVADRNLNKSTGRDYSVEQGQLVVKVIDKATDKVVREIPPKELRRIKEAIAKINRNSVISIEKRGAKAAKQIPGEQKPAQPAQPAQSAKSAQPGLNVTT